MKKNIIGLFLLCFTIFCQAQNKGILTITTTGKTYLKISFNGQRYIQEKNVSYYDVVPQTYNLEIYQYQRNEDGLSEYVLLYDSTITISPQKHTEITVLRFGKVVIDESSIKPGNWNDGLYTMDSSQAKVTHQAAVTADQLSQLKKELDGPEWDKERLDTARKILRNHAFSTNQIKILGDSFRGEETQLWFFMLAYDHCIDKNNFPKLLSLFSYPASKSDFLAFMKNT